MESPKRADVMIGRLATRNEPAIWPSASFSGPKAKAKPPVKADGSGLSQLPGVDTAYDSAWWSVDRRVNGVETGLINLDVRAEVRMKEE